MGMHKVRLTCSVKPEAALHSRGTRLHLFRYMHWTVLEMDYSTRRTGQLPRIAIALAAAFGLCVLVVAVTPAHGSDAKKSAIAVRKMAEATPVPTVTLPPGGTHYEGVGIDVTPAPSGAKAAVTAQAALASLLKNQTLDVDIKPETELLLLATDGDLGLPEQESTFLDRLSWVITIGNTAPDIRGPAMTEEQHRQIVDSLTCKNTGIVDANAGDVLAYFQTCNPR